MNCFRCDMSDNGFVLTVGSSALITSLTQLISGVVQLIMYTLYDVSLHVCTLYQC